MTIKDIKVGTKLKWTQTSNSDKEYPVVKIDEMFVYVSPSSGGTPFAYKHETINRLLESSEVIITHVPPEINLPETINVATPVGPKAPKPRTRFELIDD